jgi:phenylacetate-CoA ligase
MRAAKRRGMSFLSRAYSLPLPDLTRRYFAPGEELVDTWSPEKMLRYQKEALFKIIVHAWENCAFYRKKFRAAGVDPSALDFPGDLARIPFTTKEELRGKPWVLLAVSRQQIAQVNVSTGTTGGDEIYVPQTWEDMHVRAMAPAMKRLIPLDETDRVINALPYEMSSSGLAFHRTFQRSYGALVYPAGKGGFYSTTARTIRAARDLQATALVTTPSYAVMLAEAAAQEGISLADLPLRFMWLTGEGCSPALRDRIEALWGHPAYFYYGSLEAGPIGIECESRSGYHVTGGHAYAEVVNPRTGEPAAVGEAGEVVITELTRQASPLVRYRTGDIGVLATSRCPCGIPLQKLTLHGRAGDQVRVADRTFAPYFVEQLLLESPEAGNWYQLFPEVDRLLVKMEQAPGVKPSDAIARSMAQRIERVIGVKVDVELVPHIPRDGGKTLRVVYQS